MNINLHVDRLVLDGVDLPSHQIPAFQQAVETELARLLAKQGLGSGLVAGIAVRELPGGMVQSTGDQDPTTFGRQIARAVYRGIGR